MPTSEKDWQAAREWLKEQPNWIRFAFEQDDIASLAALLTRAREEGAAGERDQPRPDEALLIGRIRPVNGWTAGQLAQQMGADIRQSLKPGWKIDYGDVILRVHISEDAAALRARAEGGGE